MDSKEQKYKLLVVEDDEDSQRFLKLFLKREFIISMSNSGETFYHELENGEFDVILMDVSLRGEKDGLQLTREIKNDDKYKHIPVVALTAHAYQRDRAEALKAGVNFFLTKPVKNETLMETLRTAVKESLQ
ncbi:MAG: response regulator [Bacteroidetes bacterium]|nr:response regulator [Bacteroidota bacterium]MBU1114799.1 response regulator [Bacteroidota bacterium]MBU1799844.1 response regulator [Bacteroidota bacterium]